MARLTCIASIFGNRAMSFGILPVMFNEAIGGTISQIGKYAVHTFTSTGAISFTKISTMSLYSPVYYLVCGGGGGGGENTSGSYSVGGGGGGVQAGSFTSALPSYSINAIGSAGLRSGWTGAHSYGTGGGDTDFNGIVASGGQTGRPASGPPAAGTSGSPQSYGAGSVYSAFGPGGGGGGGVGGTASTSGGIVYVANGGPAYSWTLPDGTYIGSYAGGGAGGSEGGGTVFFAGLGGAGVNGGGTYGVGGDGHCRANAGSGLAEKKATDGTQGCVVVCYRNML